MFHDYDVIVAGAGMVGAAVGYGLAGQGRRVLMLDGKDTDFRAAKANFGLVWAHGKGYGQPEYQRLSLSAVKDWPEFAQQLEAESGFELSYERKGGLHFCMSENELSDRATKLGAWHAQTPELPPTTRILTRGELDRRFPSLRLGNDVAGASLGELDGHVNPLRLLAALQAAFLHRGGHVRTGRAVTAIKALPGGGFEVTAGEQQVCSERVVIAAGLGSSTLGSMVGLDVPIRPQRGQLLVTERLAPLLPIPASGLRQTGEGTVMIGVTQEEVGYDLSTTSDAAVRMARRALRILPGLASARLVRQWACLRIMTPDGAPVYASSPLYPGADIALCHSGVTLASFHAGPYARALAGGLLPNTLDVFHHDRFNVQKVA
ncbi:NAD(P)/FAD-dependent oxidoreductase [Paraburkholderia sediminicola]|uniref:NAD(P)/FAD-dependent oxidoreductase n=1 Tax=Paraburkholderia sediminicola TaxID=458836 RepID=UPI0038B94077